MMFCLVRIVRYLIKFTLIRAANNTPNGGGSQEDFVGEGRPPFADKETEIPGFTIYCYHCALFIIRTLPIVAVHRSPG